MAEGKKTDELRKKLEQYFALNEVKSLAGLAAYLGTDTAALKKDLLKKGRKGNLLRGAMTRMEHELIEYGLKGKYNATITSFLLKSAFNYQEKREDKPEPEGKIKIELSDELKKYSE